MSSSSEHTVLQRILVLTLVIGVVLFFVVVFTAITRIPEVPVDASLDASVVTVKDYECPHYVLERVCLQENLAIVTFLQSHYAERSWDEADAWAYVTKMVRGPRDSNECYPTDCIFREEEYLDIRELGSYYRWKASRVEKETIE